MKKKKKWGGGLGRITENDENASTRTEDCACPYKIRQEERIPPTQPKGRRDTPWRFGVDELGPHE